MPVTRKQSPPEETKTQRSSRWAQVFEESRQTPNVWRRVTFPLKKSTVAQVASDIRHAHERTRRMTGIQPKERFDATWAAKGGEYFVFVKKVESTK